MIPILDSLAHPTLTGRWLNRQIDARFDLLAAELVSAGFGGACAVGMAGQDGYSHREFLAACGKHKNVVPIAGIAPHPDVAIAAELEEVRRLGFGAIKIHPRFAGFSTRLGDLEDLFHAAADLGVVVFYCTYMHGRLESYPDTDPFYSLVRLLKRCPRARVVLVHGGDVRLLEYAELVRHNPNLLLDLSLTIMKYAGSSIDADINFLFRRFDRRICVGTDFPEYSHGALRERFDYFASDVVQAKLENIGFRNLQEFLAA